MSYKILLVGSLVLLVLGLSIAVVDAQRPPPGGRRAPSALAGTGFTYQGQLKNNGALVNGSCDLAFRLYDSAGGSNQIGSAITQTLPITNGLFTTPLDFGAGAFNGDARWLDLQVRCPTGVGGFTALSPRQQLTAAPYALYGLNNWGLAGNSATNPSTNFLGTIDNVTLTLRVSSTTALRLLPNTAYADSPIIIGGYSGNLANGFADGSVIYGGRPLWGANIISGTDATYSTIGGGNNNAISGGNVWNSVIAGGASNKIVGPNAYWSAIGGGQYNTISNTYATVGGGYINTAGGYIATVGGGQNNTASNSYTTVGGGVNNTASGYIATVGGGLFNTASNQYATIGGGNTNLASGYASTIGGGRFITASNSYATIGGGNNNTASGAYATISGGNSNTASGFDPSIGGGILNIANGDQATIGGGFGNTVSATVATIGGGFNNTASGYAATVPGGYYNSATMSYTLAAGNRAKANHPGVFVWADSTSADFASTGNDQFLIRATGGVGIGMSNPAAALDVNGKVHASAGFNGMCTFFDLGGGQPLMCNMDVAEAFATTELTEPGDLVVLVANASSAPTVRKSIQSYEPLLVGAVSTNAGLVFDNGETRLAGDNSQLITANKTIVALVGRVPVKVSIENGVIAVGDPLTSSSRPGVAMKATRAAKIIGYAMQAAERDGTTLALIQPGYYLSPDQLVTQQQNAALEARVAALERDPKGFAERPRSEAERGGNPSGLGSPDWNAAIAFIIGAIGVVIYERARKGGMG